MLTSRATPIPGARISTAIPKPLQTSSAKVPTLHRLQRRAVSAQGTEALDEKYNKEMQRQMHWEKNPYEYHFDRGLYYHEIIPNLFCGTQPRHHQDVVDLKRLAGVTTILSLQQDKDMHYWGVSPHEVHSACSSNGIDLIRRPARDFDPHSLRKALPEAVHVLRGAMATQNRVYVHCTAGLGRAPAVCIAYLYWFEGMTLDQAYKFLTDKRPCGPKRDAIRGATYDLLGQADFGGFDRLPQDAYAVLSPESRLVLQGRVLRGH